MSTESSPDAASADADISHRSAAEKFFSADASSAPDPTPAPADPKPAPAPTAPDPLAAVLKSAKQAAPAAAPAADPQIDDIDKGLQAPREDSKSRAGWDELKKRASEERKLRLELEQKLKTAPTSTVDEATKARLAELETQNKTYSERLKLIDLRSHPEFIAKYVEPANAAKAAMESIAKTDEVDVNIGDILTMKGKALNAAVSDVMDKMTPYARVKFQAALDQYFATQVNADQAIAQADETLKSMRQTGGARSRASFDEVAKNYSEAFIPAQVDEKSPDAEKQAAAAYNAALSSIGKQAETYAFGQIDERGVADLSHKAALYEFTMNHGIPRIASLYGAALSARDAKIAELETQVKALTGANPSLAGGSGAPGAGDNPPANESHMDAARRYFSR